MQEGAPSVRFVARAGREGRHSGGPESLFSDLLKKLLTPRARHAEHLHAQPASKLMKPVRFPPGWVSAVMEASRRYRHYSPLLAHK